MVRHSYPLLVILVCLSCGTVRENNVAARKEISSVTIQDTMVLDGKDDLMKTPDSRGDIIVTLDRCTVFVLSKTPVPNIQTTNVVDTFVKVRTRDNDTGFVWKRALITLSQLKARNDSLQFWSKQPMPLYSNLIGTSYWRNDELPLELSPGGFISVGADNRYGIISISNQHTDRYSYLFFVENTGRTKDRDNELLIHDIIALDWEKFGPDAQPWFQQCECVDSVEDCSEVVAVYRHSDEMANQGIMITPLKAWRPDYSKPSLKEINVETVKCGSMAPEEDLGESLYH